jgi:NAD(P)-dependent dehydrogenase (short-subunit alcohol dehydrogenase family)
VPRWTEADLPDQTGRVALITGANSGIGFDTARSLASRGAHVVMACRNVERARAAESEISSAGGSTEVLQIDLADLASVTGAAEQFLAGHDRLHLLINNAGMMATPEQRTSQGLEWQLGINHFGHFALTGQLLGVLMGSEQSRVVTVSSLAHGGGVIDFADLNSERSYSPWAAYGRSKLANLLFMSELQRRLAAADSSTISVAAHPGISATNLSSGMGGITSKLVPLIMPLVNAVIAQPAAMGALPTLRAATDPTVTGGDYFGPDGRGERKGYPVRVGMTDRASNTEDAQRLWEESERLTGVSYGI